MQTATMLMRRPNHKELLKYIVLAVTSVVVPVDTKRVDELPGSSSTGEEVWPCANSNPNRQSARRSARRDRGGQTSGTERLLASRELQVRSPSPSSSPSPYSGLSYCVGASAKCGWYQSQSEQKSRKQLRCHRNRCSPISSSASSSSSSS